MSTYSEDVPTVSRTLRFGLLLEGTAPIRSGLGPDMRKSGLKTVLSWRADDPYAVLMTFPRGEKWLVGRCLLEAGLERRAGLYDVSVQPHRDDASWIELHLSSPSGRICFLTPATDLEEFLWATWHVVPSGEEPLWIDFSPEQFGADSGGGWGVPA